MTRENKLALVVGFALILLVGILVSDHFSAASQQEAADLAPAHDPLVDAARGNPDLLRVEPAAARSFHDPFAGRSALPIQTTQTMQAMPTMQTPQSPDRAGAASPVTPGGTETRTVHMPDLLDQPVRRVGLTPDQGRDLPYVFHEVRVGESLSSICVEYYGDTSLLRDLAEYNDVSNPDLVRVGTRLRVPRAAVLVRGETPRRSGAGGASAVQGGSARAAAAQRTYTVQSGDVLTRIAQRQLGSAGRWRDLYRHNKDVIRNPDNIKVGTVLRIPD